MRVSRIAVMAALTAAVLLASGCAEPSPAASGGAAPATPARCTQGGTWAAAEPVSPGTANNDLTGVTVLPDGEAWAVGSYASGTGGQTLTEHWSGTAWSVVSSPDPGGSGSFLSGVSAVSPSDVWAVGEDQLGGQSRTLAVHWTGSGWQQVASPSPGPESYLTAVHAVSASDAWAVGYYRTAPSGNGSVSLILHWDGTRWARVPSPDPGVINQLSAVTAVSATSAWAVGSSGATMPALPFILHWDGTAWTRATTAPPLNATAGELLGVDATSAGNAWAAGDITDRTGQHTLILHWNGNRWTRSPSPGLGGPGLLVSLHGVAAVSPGNAWAAGEIDNGAGAPTSVILHWNGSAWTRVASPSPGSGGGPEGLAASPAAAGGAWAWSVGQYGGAGAARAFGLRYCTPPPAG